MKKIAYHLEDRRTPHQPLQDQKPAEASVQAKHIREFSEETHGADWQKTADEFKETNKDRIKKTVVDDNDEEAEVATSEVKPKRTRKAKT